MSISRSKRNWLLAALLGTVAAVPVGVVLAADDPGVVMGRMVRAPSAEAIGAALGALTAVSLSSRLRRDRADRGSQ